MLSCLRFTLPSRLIPQFLTACLFAAMLPAGSATATPLPPGFTIGSANVAIADPTVPRPPTTPCTVTLFANQAFADFNSHNFSYTPPSGCAGPWAQGCA